jgi:hypothetical protein
MDQFDPDKIAQELAKQAGEDNKITIAGQDAIRAYNQRLHQQDRSFIVKGVFFLYLGAIGSLAVFYLYRGFRFDDNTAISSLVDLIKIAVLPVVTLVIGYYFGTKSE